MDTTSNLLIFVLPEPKTDIKQSVYYSESNKSDGNLRKHNIEEILSEIDSNSIDYSTQNISFGSIGIMA